MSEHFWLTRFVRFGAKSVTALERTATVLTPSGEAAATSPSSPSWLNDLSSNPPLSETMHGLTPATAALVAAAGFVADVGACPHAESKRGAVVSMTPTVIDFFA